MPTYHFVWTGHYNPLDHIDRTFALVKTSDNLLTSRADCTLFLTSRPAHVPTAPDFASTSAAVNGASRTFGLRWTNVRKRTRIVGGSIHLVEKKLHATAEIPAMTMNEDVNGDVVSLPRSFWHRSPVWFHCFVTITVDEPRSYIPSPLEPIAAGRASDWLLTEHPNDVQFIFPNENVSLWANSELLKSISPYFVMLLSSSVAEEAKRTVLESHKSAKRDETSSLGTEDDEEVAEHWESDDSDGEQEVDPRYALPSRSSGEEEDGEDFSVCSVPAHRITVTKTKAATYHAFLRWVLTGKIDFAPLRSQIASSGDEGSEATGAPSVSPKSIYRLAHLLETTQLQDLALKSFENQISVENCAAELYSEFCGIYAEPREIVLELVVDNWRTVKASKEMKEVLEHMHEGKYRHHTLIAAELLKRL